MKSPYLSTAFLLASAHLANSTHLISDDVGVASRVLRYSFRASNVEQNSQNLEESAEKVLNELYNPTVFDCDCEGTPGTLRSRSTYGISCKSLKSVCHANVCGVVQWDATFDSSLEPDKEEVCISFHGTECEALSGKQVCYGFDYDGTKATSCAATVDARKCNSCEVCGYTQGSNGGVQYMAPDCSNISGLESKKYSCDDMKTIQDFNNVSFQCPEKEDKNDDKADKTTKTDRDNSKKKSAKSSKSNSSKSSKKGSRRALKKKRPKRGVRVGK